LIKNFIGFLSLPSYLGVSNCDIDFFIICHRFCITGKKFPKFERGQNAAEKFQIGNNESVQLLNSWKVNETII
jgi:hypothetical protein